MNKILVGLIVGAVLGLIDGATAWFTPEVRVADAQHHHRIDDERNHRGHRGGMVRAARAVGAEGHRVRFLCRTAARVRGCGDAGSAGQSLLVADHGPRQHSRRRDRLGDATVRRARVGAALRGDGDDVRARVDGRRTHTPRTDTITIMQNRPRTPRSRSSRPGGHVEREHAREGWRAHHRRIPRHRRRIGGHGDDVRRSSRTR